MADYFDTTLPTMRARGDAVILLGDFNWHSESWLGSNKTTDAGVHAEGVFVSRGLEQLVDLPTRGENMLDLIITDIHASSVKVSDREQIGKSDHCVLIADVALSLAREPRTTRTIWNYAEADWGRLRKHLRGINWDEKLAAADGSNDPELQCRERVTHDRPALVGDPSTQ